MKARSLYHLVRAETERNLLFVIAFWIILFLFHEESELIVICGCLLIAKLALGDNINRPSAIWKRLPVSFTEWVVSRIVLLLIWIVFPALIQQGWVIHLTLLNRSSAAHLLLETGTLTFAFSIFAFSLFSAAKRWGQALLFIGGAVILGTVVPLLIESYFENRSGLPAGVSWTTQADLVPRPEIWWLLIAGLTLLSLLYLHWMTTNRGLLKISLATAFVFTAGLSGIYLASENDFEIKLKEAPEALFLTEETIDETQHHQFQTLYSDVQIGGVNKGTFVNPIKISADGKERYTQNLSEDLAPYGWKRFCREHSLSQYLRKQGELFFATNPNLFGNHRDHTLANTPKLDFRKTVRKAYEDDNLSRIRIRGKALRWIKSAEIPFSETQFQTAGGISGKLIRRESEGNRVSRKYTLTLFRPKLRLSNRSTLSHYGPGANELSEIQLIAFHEEFKECLLLETQETGYASVPTLFTSIDSMKLIFTLPENSAWGILWPDEDATEKWLEGARLQLYTTKYLGRFEDEIYLTDAPD